MWQKSAYPNKICYKITKTNAIDMKLSQNVHFHGKIQMISKNLQLLLFSLFSRVLYCLNAIKNNANLCKMALGILFFVFLIKRYAQKELIYKFLRRYKFLGKVIAYSKIDCFILFSAIVTSQHGAKWLN